MLALCAVFTGCGGVNEELNLDNQQSKADIIGEYSVAEACPAGFRDSLEDGTHKAFAVADQQRSFELALPEGGFSGRRPLMILFHGTSGSGKSAMRSYGGQELLDRGFIVAAPDSVGNGTVWRVWDAMRLQGEEERENKDLRFFDGLVNCVAAHHKVDFERIYIAGHSAGGIMVNAMLQRRSKVLAGGITASGLLELTAPVPAAPLGEMAVLVTWGGDNDNYSGGTRGVTVPQFNFVEQAAMATQFYAEAPAVKQAWCRGGEIGHRWLGQSDPRADDWMFDFLLAHPKGQAAESSWTMEAPDKGAGFTCGEGAVEIAPPVEVSCGTNASTGCRTYCQFIGDCVVENGTLRPALGPQLSAIGFSGDDLTECSGCLEQCSAVKSGEDQEVLDCFQGQASAMVCGGGINGAAPFIEAVNTCCAGAQESQICGAFCTAILDNSAARSFFPTCESWQ